MNFFGVVAGLLFVAFSSAAPDSQRLSLWNYYHRHRNESSDTSIRRVLKARNAQKGIFDFKQLRALVEVRSRLYDEAIRLSNVFPGQANTVPVAIRHKSRLSDGMLTWSCKDCPPSDQLLLEHNDGSDEISNENLSETHDDTDRLKEDNNFPIESYDQDQPDLQMTEAFEPVNISRVVENLTAQQQQFTTSLMKEAYEFIWYHIVSLESLESSTTLETTDSETVAFPLQPPADTNYELETISYSKPDSDVYSEESMCSLSNSHWIFPVERLSPLSESSDGDMAPHHETIVPELIELWEHIDTSTSSDVHEQPIAPMISDFEMVPEDHTHTDLIEYVDITAPPLDLATQLTHDANVSTIDLVEAEEAEETRMDQQTDPLPIDQISANQQGANVQTEVRPRTPQAGVHRSDESMTIAFSSIRLQLLVGLVLSTFFLLFILFVRLYQYMVLYPTNLVAWLEEESTKAFNAGDFVALHALLSKYFPRVEWFFGLQDLETTNLLHYLARSEMALGQNESAKSNLERLIQALLPYGEDEYLASVYEDYGFVQHALGNHLLAVDALHKALRMISEEQVCRYEMDHGSVSVGKAVSETDWLDDHERHITSSSENEDHNNSAMDEDLLRSFEGDHQLEAISLQKRLHLFGAGTSEDDIDAATATLSHSSSLMHSFGSPSTLDLNEALMVHADLNHAVRELEFILDDPEYSAKKRATEMASWRVSDNEDDSSNFKERGALLFGDFLAVPTLEVARLCKKLGDVYRDAEDFAQAQVFFRNALSVVRRLNSSFGLENDIEELESLIANLAHCQMSQSMSPVTGAHHSFDPAVYNRFRIG